MNDAFAHDGLLAPVDALRQGFDLGDATSSSAALISAYASNAALASVDDRAAQRLPRQGFQIGHLGLMIRYEDGSELADLPPTYRLPNAPAWFVGVTNLHGLLIPVFDLGTYLGVAHQEGAKPMLLVLGHGADAAGVVIDGLPVRLRIHPDERAENAPVHPALQGTVLQTYWANDRTWMDLQVDRLLNHLSEELAAINA